MKIPIILFITVRESKKFMLESKTNRCAYIWSPRCRNLTWTHKKMRNDSFGIAASRGQHWYLFDITPSADLLLLLAGCGGDRWVYGGNWLRSAVRGEKWTRRATRSWMGGTTRVRRQFLTEERWRKLSCRSDGRQKIKNEVPDWIYVTFTVTLHCFSLSKCHILSWKSAHPCHISASLHQGSKILLTVFCIRC